jgi:hypothetical protein
MAAFHPGETITTKEPEIVVDAGLTPGEHHFQLVVVDDRGRASDPAVLVVVVKIVIPPIVNPQR